MTQEIFKDIKGYDDCYKVSNLGNVVSYKKNEPKIMSKIPDKDGYHRANIRNNGKMVTVKVHRLMMFAFKGDLYFPGAQVNHIDGDKTNNNLSNLEWVTPKRNSIHAFEIGLRKKGVSPANTKIVLDTQTGIFYNSICDAARAHNLKFTCLHNRMTKGKSQIIYV